MPFGIDSASLISDSVSVAAAASLVSRDFDRQSERGSDIPGDCGQSSDLADWASCSFA